METAYDPEAKIILGDGLNADNMFFNWNFSPNIGVEFVVMTSDMMTNKIIF